MLYVSTSSTCTIHTYSVYVISVYYKYMYYTRTYMVYVLYVAHYTVLYYCRHPRTQCLALNYIVKFISHKASFKDIYREAGILTLLNNALQKFTEEIKNELVNEEDTVLNIGMYDRYMYIYYK